MHVQASWLRKVRSHACCCAHRKLEDLVHVDEARAAGMQVIKRFSGGGTVVVDANTVFSTLILQAAAVPGVECYPRPIMRWSEGFYRPVFGPHGDFSLREHGWTHCHARRRECISTPQLWHAGRDSIAVVCPLQITRLVSASLVATRRPSLSSAGCITHPCCGTLSPATWLS